MGKALHRKGKALYELQRYEEAVQSFQLALMESPGNSQINGDLMVARRKLRSNGPSPAPKTFAPPPRSRDPRNESSCIIEEVVDDEDGGVPAPGYTRVQIEEDSDTEEEEVADPSLNKVAFHKVQIEEEVTARRVSQRENLQLRLLRQLQPASTKYRLWMT